MQAMVYGYERNELKAHNAGYGLWLWKKWNS